MQFGRATNIDNIDLSLPKDNEHTLRILKSAKSSVKKAEIYIGGPVWSHKDWVGKIYPPKTKAADYLKFYAQKVNAIELNTTHYRIPDKNTIKKWKEAVPKGFKFSPKFLQQVSHARNFKEVQDLTKAFCNAIKEFDEYLGVSFFQLPPYFSPDRFDMLSDFVKNFPKEIPLAIELRHEGWFSDKETFEKTFGLFEKNNISAVITDVAGRRDVLHQRLTTPVAFIRFTGHDLHPTDYSRLDEWVNKLKQWSDMGLQQINFYIHEPDKSKLPEILDYGIKKFNKTLGAGFKEIDFSKGQEKLF